MKGLLGNAFLTISVGKEAESSCCSAMNKAPSYGEGGAVMGSQEGSQAVFPTVQR